jgi:hypothetical protein
LGYNSGFESRSVVNIKNIKNNLSIYCECLEIDKNYKFVYNNPPRENIEDNRPTITMNGWYRKRLGGLQTKIPHELEIRAANGWYGKLRANLQHPQVVVRLATWLAIISVGLGVLGVCLSVKFT